MKCWLQADMILRPLVFQSMFFLMLCWVVSMYLLKVVVVAVFVVVVVVVVVVPSIFGRSRWSQSAKASKARQCNPVRSCQSPKRRKDCCVCSVVVSHMMLQPKKRWQGYDVISFNPYHTMSYHVYSMIIVEKYVCMLHMSYLGGASIMIKLFMYLGWFWYPP